jgi:hypothetical protein
MAPLAEASMGVSDGPGRVAAARGLLITQRWQSIAADTSTADEYRNASDPERPPHEPPAAPDLPPTTLTDRVGTSSYREGQVSAETDVSFRVLGDDVQRGNRVTDLALLSAGPGERLRRGRLDRLL